ncbi:MAG: NosD domain-containing protein [Planctomycetota bacterium]|jgi:parallel beta-helix repeat protein
MRPVAALLLVASLAAPGEDGSDLERPFAAGTHRLTKPLRISGSGRTVDLSGVVLLGAEEGVPPDRFEGIGILVEGCRRITIRGGRLKGFRCAILVKNCEEVAILGVDVSGNFRQRLKSTPEREDASDWLWPHENDEQQWRRNYGAGICLENSKSCQVSECIGREQQNGILLDRCTRCRIFDNDFSFNSGWGIALWRSSKNWINRNSCDWCVRGYSHGVYDRGQDSAGILVFEQCNENLFWGNSATHGGDGFFLYAGNETLKSTGKGGCNDNLVVSNDFSHAVANGIEATFSTKNRFVENICDDCNYGIWAGYSYGCVFQSNKLRSNSIAGIAIEHGMDNVIQGNVIERNPRGVWLWWDDDKDLLASRFGQTRPCRSEGYRFVKNRFVGNKADVYLRDTSKVSFGESFPATLVKRGRCEEITTGAVSGVDPGGFPEFEIAARRITFLPEGVSRGRRQIMIDEWGPVDPQKPAVFPRHVVAWERCAFHVLGPETGFRVEGLADGLRVEREPRSFRVVGGEAGLLPFECVVLAGEERFAVTGVLLNATWEVGFWKWEKDPRKHAGTFAEDPAERMTMSRLDFRWKSAGPCGGDRFATRARTHMTLPEGRYEVRTLSDDGVRVIIDGRVVQEDWTWHAPKESRTVVELAAGDHEIVVEHFEIDGQAVLSFDLRPVK